MSLIEVTEGDHGYGIQVTLYKSDDNVVVEDLTSAATVNLDITRKDVEPLVSNASVNIYNDVGGVVNFTPAADWFTSEKLNGISDYVAVFKIGYSSGQKKSLTMPFYVHLK